jgi:hypothetical protein
LVDFKSFKAAVAAIMASNSSSGLIKLRPLLQPADCLSVTSCRSNKQWRREIAEDMAEKACVEATQQQIEVRGSTHAFNDNNIQNALITYLLLLLSPTCRLC